MNTPAFKPLRGTLTVSGDKSISHRAVMLGSLATGTTEIEGFLPGEDCLSTIRCFRSMGVQIEQNGSSVKVFGRGLRELTAPAGILDCGNSGTTTRLLSGVLAAQHFNSVRRRFDSAPPDEAHHDTASRDGGRYHQCLRKRLCPPLCSRQAALRHPF